MKHLINTWLINIFEMNIINMLSNNRLRREILWIGTGQTMTAVVGLIGVKLLTNILGPSEFGNLALANTVVALISTNFLFGPLGQNSFTIISRFRIMLSINRMCMELRNFYFSGALASTPEIAPNP